MPTTRDKLARLLHDRVITLADEIDGLVRRLSTAYTLRGQIATVSSHDDPTPGQGAVINEVAFSYSRATEQGARQPAPLWGLPEGRDMQCLHVEATPALPDRRPPEPRRPR